VAGCAGELERAQAQCGEALADRQSLVSEIQLLLASISGLEGRLARTAQAEAALRQQLHASQTEAQIAGKERRELRDYSTMLENTHREMQAYHDDKTSQTKR
jgi:chromosome segregation ATPase